jgi:hypothetical protein
MTDYTTDHRFNLEAYLATHTLPKGLGDTESACTLAAINLAMSGDLTDDIPDCMSEVLGRAAIGLQDAMPDEMRNGQRYKRLIPDMPGTGRAQEQERLAIMLDWVWTAVLPHLQPIADKDGFGEQWRLMCKERTPDAAAAASDAAARAAAAAANAARAADAAANDARAADAAAAASDAAAAAANDAAYAANDAANAAAYAAAAPSVAAADFWATVDPIGVLERMTYLTGAKP